MNLKQLFSRTEQRSVANDFTIRYKNVRYQIAEEEADGIRPKDRIILEHRLDATLRLPPWGPLSESQRRGASVSALGPSIEPRPKGLTPPRKSRAKPGPKHIPVPT